MTPTPSPPPEVTPGRERRRKLRVYAANYDGRREVLGAFYNRADFMRLSGASRAYVGETGNPSDIRVARERPGVVFIRSINAREGEPWAVFKE